MRSPEIARRPAKPEHGADPDEGEHLEQRVEHGVEAGEVEGAVDDLVALPPEAGRECGTRAEPFDDTDPADGLFDESRCLAPGLLQLPRAELVLARVAPGREGDERHRDQDEQRELHVEHQHHDRDGDDRDHVADRVADRVHHPGNVLGVGRRPAQQLAGADPVVVRGVESERVGEDGVANARVRGRAVADRVDVADATRDDLEQADAHEGEEPDQQRVAVVRGDPAVDRVLDDERRADRADLPEQSGDGSADDALRLLAHDGAHKSPRCGAAYLASAHWGKVPTCPDHRWSSAFPVRR